MRSVRGSERRIHGEMSVQIVDRQKCGKTGGRAKACRKRLGLAGAAALAATYIFAAPGAQAQSPSFSVQKFSAKVGGYADLVEVRGPSKTLFLWGTGAEDEASTTPWAPDIRHRGNFAGQCAYSLEKIGRMLAGRGASFADVTTIRAFLIDGRHTDALYTCLDKVYAGSATKPAVTSFNISQLAHSGMLLELEVTAALPDRGPNSTFSIYRNSETLGKWNPGAIEVLEVSGPDRTVYFSGAQATKQQSGKSPVAMFPGDFAKQCEFAQGNLLRLAKSEGMVASNVVRQIKFIPGYFSIPDLMKCDPPPADSFRAGASTLSYVSQLSAVGDLYALDALGMAALKPNQSATIFKKNVIPSKLTADIPSAIVVSGPRRTFHIAGLGSQDETGKIRFVGDFKAQCAASVERIGALLKAHKSSLKDVVKMLVFVTDSRYEPEFRTCMSKAFPGAQPAQTFVNVARLPQSGMLIQIDATAVAAPGI